jgi:hypothetical protein
MTDILTSQNIVLSSWNTLYEVPILMNNINAFFGMYQSLGWSIGSKAAERNMASIFQVNDS